MNKEEIVSSAIMIMVSLLMIIGFTIAWYTGNQDNATVSGIKMVSADLKDITIALESGGEDISVLKTNGVKGDEYVIIGMEELTQVDGKMAPGTRGTAVFYLTPEKTDIRSCEIIPQIGIYVNEEWCYGESLEDGVADSGNSEDISNEELYEIALRHIRFFKDEAMTQQLDTGNPLVVEWMDEDYANGQFVEKTAPIYWQWYYEYPFTAEEEMELSEEEKQLRIKGYDDEDVILGNHISKIKFRFSFSVN